MELPYLGFPVVSSWPCTQLRTYTFPNLMQPPQDLNTRYVKGEAKPGIKVQLGRRMQVSSFAALNAPTAHSSSPAVAHPLVLQVLYPPSSHEPSGVDGAPPESSVEISWVYGYNGTTCRNNAKFNADSDVVLCTCIPNTPCPCTPSNTSPAEGAPLGLCCGCHGSGLQPRVACPAALQWARRGHPVPGHPPGPQGAPWGVHRSARGASRERCFCAQPKCACAPQHCTLVCAGECKDITYVCAAKSTPPFMPPLHVPLFMPPRTARVWKSPSVVRSFMSLRVESHRWQQGVPAPLGSLCPVAMTSGPECSSFEGRK